MNNYHIEAGSRASRHSPPPARESVRSRGEPRSDEVIERGDGHGETRGMSLQRRLIAEALGTGLLLVAVVGSGILGERLAAGNTAIALLASALATGAALFALIKWIEPLSGAHFNPVISLAMAVRGDITSKTAAAYVATQAIAALIGVGIANAMFETPIFSLSAHARSGHSQLLSEFVSTFGLVGAVWVCSRLRPSSVAGVVSAYVGSGFWFTPTGFANPAVAFARAFTDTFSGIRLSDVPGFIAAEVIGATAAVLLFRWLLPGNASVVARGLT